MDWKELVENSKIVDKKLVINSKLVETIGMLKNKFHFDILKEIIAIDNNENFELIYKLYSTEDEEEAYISIFVEKEIESISKLFDSAVADEKEIYDLFGINFIGNDELKRLYMPEDWLGHPLRKDYENNDKRLRWND
jgi:NADH-quinone oxidoreductase subunit C